MAHPPFNSLRLPRQRRLKDRRDFARIKAEGKRLARGCLAANWLPSGAGVASRVGIITGRRLGGAVERSRARRLLREVFRRHQHELQVPLDLVLIARPSIGGKKLGEVELDFMAVLARSGLLKPSA
jgi:ribonuclease P protein component